MTLDEAIKHCLDIADGQDKCAEISVSEHAKERISQCAADHRQLAEWLTELKQWRRVYGVCPSYEMCIPECKEGYNAQIAEYKRLLKAAVEDFTAIAEVRAAAAPILCPKYYEAYMKAIDVRTRKWRYAAEALALIGEDTNVPASADGKNVGHKSGGWISCKDYMPDTLERGLSTMYSDCCLVCDAFGWIGMAYYITDGQKSWWEFADAQNKNKIDWTEVTHWQLLPEPPKDGDT